MDGWSASIWIDVVGYMASALVFLTFCMHTMLPLRAAAIGSNILFIIYGFASGAYPVLALHLILLPMNMWRTVELIRLARRGRAATQGAVSLDWLKPFSRKVTLRPDAILFEKGDAADHLYFIVSGRIALDETEIVLDPGELLGELGLFAPDRQRTLTARALGTAHLLRIDAQDIERLCVQHPEVTFTLLRVITLRLLSNHRAAPAQPQPLPYRDAAS